MLRACVRFSAVTLAVVALAVVALAAQASHSLAAECDVRLRIAWGSSGQSPQKWHGAITVEGAKLADLQPLGVEPDEAAALRLVGNEIQISPLVRRTFDGCDVSIRGDETAVVRIELKNAAATPAKALEFSLGELARELRRVPLDELGSSLLIDRAPGDKLRVQFDREHLVFDPGETFKFAVAPDLAPEAAGEAFNVEARLCRENSAEVIWQSSNRYDPGSTEPITFEVPLPADEGAYRIALVAVRPAGRLADRLVPWEKPAPLANRDVGLVVVDPARPLRHLTSEWELVSTIDPANSSWWQRIPHWTSFDKLPAFATPRPLGNVKPSANPLGHPGLVALASPQEPSSSGAAEFDAAWQAYLLPVRSIGQPHAVEIEVPRGLRQHLAVSLIEPDAAGRVLTFGRDCGVYSEERLAAGSREGVDLHRIVFWPRTRSPALLIVNRSPTGQALYGKIRLLKRAEADPPAASDMLLGAAGRQGSPSRLVAAYLGQPRLNEALGASEQLDPQSGLSVDSWGTYLRSASRLAQQLRSAGYNAAIISIASDGSSLAPIDGLGQSPRYDSGLLASSGVDPLRKDVLELLLRIFDREGLRLIPAVQLSTPLPALETLKSAADAPSPGIAWIDDAGRTWSECYPTETATAPHYNLLNPAVQQALTEIVDELANRYGQHPSLAGIALQLHGGGYGVLPGLGWGYDDATWSRFAAATKAPAIAAGDDRFARRASAAMGAQLAAWKQWRRAEVASFYAELASRVARDRADRRLVLCTEDLFAGSDAAERIRQAVAGRASIDDALDEVGVDVKSLAASPDVLLLRPRRLGAGDSVDLRAIDQRVNSAPEFDHHFAGQLHGGELFFYTPSRLRLPSFDQQSPFGADKTHLALNGAAVPAGAAATGPLAASLAARDFAILTVGAEQALLADNDAHARALRTFQQLPPPSAEIRTESRQPVLMRVYREAESATVCLINESSWPVDISLSVGCDSQTAWRQLGGSPPPNAKEPDRAESGVLAEGTSAWSLELPPFAVVARRFSSPALRIGALTLKPSPEAIAELNQRIAEVEGRMQGLDIERPYNQLQNPDFEASVEDGRLFGWQPRIGAAGAINLQADAAGPVAPAGHSIHLHSQDATGVAVQSHLFPIPATGQITIRARVRTAELQPGAKLYAWAEFQSGGAMRQRYFTLRDDRAVQGPWTECEFAIDDLPLSATGQMRLQFHLAGAGHAWVDDVRLYDLRFPKSQREALAKRLYAAKAALEEGQLVDCQRLIDGYWPRRLVEHVTPAMVAAQPTGRSPAPSTPTDDAQAKGLSDRLRNMVPKILR